jgi:quercetin dioxygenase-like cupin family protein
MIIRMSFVSASLLVALVGVTAAQQPTFKRTELQRGDLSAPGREVVQAVVDFQPKGTSGKHMHPGEEVGYILDGTIRFELDGQAPVMKKAGDYFFVPAGKTHNATSVGPGMAKVLATYIVEKGKPLATPVP